MNAVWQVTGLSGRTLLTFLCAVGQALVASCFSRLSAGALWPRPGSPAPGREGGERATDLCAAAAARPSAHC